MAARQALPGLSIRGIDPREETLAFALRQGVIDRGFPHLPDSFEDAFPEPSQPGESHLVVLACHLAQSLEWLDKMASRIEGETGRDILVTDIGSCKRAIVELGRKRLPERFIAGHPMAGGTLSGIEHATASLFTGKTYLLCPHAGTDPMRLDQLEGFIRLLGASPRRLDAERHDRAMAYVSHFPQLYAILLANLLDGPHAMETLACHGGGLEDQLRLAGSSHAMWGGIFRQNGDNLARVLREFKALIDDVLPDLAPGHANAPDFLPPGAERTAEPWLARFERANRLERQFQALRNRPE
jgi:prephenate dehydrogenase